MTQRTAKAKPVVTDPTVCGGDPTLEGTRIRVSDIVIGFEHRGLSAEEIVDQFDTLHIQDVYAALTYYHEHPDEIRDEIQARDAAHDPDANR